MTRDEWLTVTHYAERFDVDPRTVYKWMKAGLLETFRIGRLLRIKNQPPLMATTSVDVQA